MQDGLNPFAGQRKPGVVDSVTGAVCVDLDCRKCGYNLRTLLESGLCPECGSPVGLSTRGNYLQFANPEWVARVAKGLQIVFAMIFVNIILQFSAGCIRTLPALIPGLLGVAVTIVDVIGVWMMTEPDPSGIGEEKNVSARKVVRVSSVVAAGGALLQLASIGAVSIGGGVPFLGVLLIIVGVIAGLAGLVAWFTRYSFFAIIARRIPDEILAGRALMIRKGSIICAIVGIVGGTIAAVTSGAGGQTGDIGVGLMLIMLVPAGFGFLVFAIWTIVLIYRLQAATTEESLRAKLNWTLDKPAWPVPATTPAPSSGTPHTETPGSRADEHAS